MHYLLIYETSADYLERRGQFRTEHLALGWQASDRGELVMGGALANPADGAVLIFKGDSPEVAKKFAQADPYVRNGLIKSWRVREWATVIGKESSNPIRPGA